MDATNFLNASDWALRVEEINDGTYTQDSLYYRNLIFDTFDWTFSKRIILVWVHSTTAKKYWRNGGFLRQMVFSNLFPMSSPRLMVQQRYSIPLFHPTILFFSEVTEGYLLEFDPQYWLTQVEIRIWEYLGDDSTDSELQLDTIIANQNTIVNTLNGT